MLRARICDQPTKKEDASSSLARWLRAFSLLPSYTEEAVHTHRQQLGCVYIYDLIRWFGFHPIEIFSSKPTAYLEQLPLVLEKYKKRVPAPVRHEDFLSVLTLACDMLKPASPFDPIIDYAPYAVCVLAYAFRFVCNSSIGGWHSLVSDIFVVPQIKKRRYVCIMDQRISWHTPSKRSREEEEDEEDECCFQPKRVHTHPKVEMCY